MFFLLVQITVFPVIVLFVTPVSFGGSQSSQNNPSTLVKNQPIINGDLEWSSTEFIAKGSKSPSKVSATFTLVNRGTKTLHIEPLRIDGACFYYYVSDRVLRPNQEIKFKFLIMTKHGGGITEHIYQVPIKDEQETKLYPLKILVDTPLHFDISQRTLYWELGSMDKKEVLLRIKKDSGVWVERMDIYGTKTNAFTYQTEYVHGGIDDPFDYYKILIQPTFPSALSPIKYGAIGFLGIELRRHGQPLKTMVEVINWPTKPPAQ